nr:uncharacterized protein LOC120368069 [Saimiri boliviensis boliviensis]
MAGRGCCLSLLAPEGSGSYLAQHVRSSRTLLMGRSTSSSSSVFPSISYVGWSEGPSATQQGRPQTGGKAEPATTCQVVMRSTCMVSGVCTCLCLLPRARPSTAVPIASPSAPRSLTSCSQIFSCCSSILCTCSCILCHCSRILCSSSRIFSCCSSVLCSCCSSILCTCSRIFCSCSRIFLLLLQHLVHLFLHLVPLLTDFVLLFPDLLLLLQNLVLLLLVQAPPAFIFIQLALEFSCYSLHILPQVCGLLL